MLKQIRFQVPKKEELQKKRAINLKELNPNLDNWNGWLGKDKKGIYTYATEYKKDILKPLKGEKIYIEDFYNTLENKIIMYYEKAKQVITKTNNNIKSVFDLMHLESILIVLKRIHSNPYDDMFLTNTKLDEIILKESSLQDYIDYINNINILKVSTPLGIGASLKQVFKESFTMTYIHNYSNFTLEDFSNNNKYLN